VFLKPLFTLPHDSFHGLVKVGVVGPFLGGLVVLRTGSLNVPDKFLVDLVGVHGLIFPVILVLPLLSFGLVLGRAPKSPPLIIIVGFLPFFILPFVIPMVVLFFPGPVFIFFPVFLFFPGPVFLFFPVLLIVPLIPLFSFLSFPSRFGVAVVFFEPLSSLLFNHSDGLGGVEAFGPLLGSIVMLRARDFDGLDEVPVEFLDSLLVLAPFFLLFLAPFFLVPVFLLFLAPLFLVPVLLSLRLSRSSTICLKPLFTHSLEFLDTLRPVEVFNPLVSSLPVVRAALVNLSPELLVELLVGSLLFGTP
jgi:hypothetical protein